MESIPAYKAAQRCTGTKALVHKVMDAESGATEKACSNTEISSGQSFGVLHAKANGDRLVAAVPPAMDNDECNPDVYDQASVTAPADCETTGGDVASCLWFVPNILDIFSRLFLALSLLFLPGSFASVSSIRIHHGDSYARPPWMSPGEVLSSKLVRCSWYVKRR